MTRVSVTQEDIDQGLRAACELCPVALALLRSVPDATGARAGITYCTVRTRHVFLQGDLPQSTQRFIGDFDRDLPVEPFEFEVELQEVGSSA